MAPHSSTLAREASENCRDVKFSGHEPKRPSEIKGLTWQNCDVLSYSVMSDSLWPHGLQPARLPLFMGIFLARILEWVVMPSSSGSSQPMDRTQVSHIASGFSTVWATREAHSLLISSLHSPRTWTAWCNSCCLPWKALSPKNDSLYFVILFLPWF